MEASLSKQGITDLPAVLQLFENLLCFDAWLQKDKFWPLDDQEERVKSAQAAVELLLKRLITSLPIKSGNGWNKPKTHELMHIVCRDMVRYGKPTGFDANRPENHHGPRAKTPGNRAKKKHDDESTFERQAATRLSDSIILQTLYKKVFNDDTRFRYSEEKRISPDADAVPPNPKSTATHGQLSKKDDGRFVIEWHTTTSLPTMGLPAGLPSFVDEHFGSPVSICTEYCHNGVIYRCHPNYGSAGPIYDWMMAYRDASKLPGSDGVPMVPPNKKNKKPLKKNKRPKKTPKAPKPVPARLVAVLLAENNVFTDDKLIVQFSDQRLVRPSSVLMEHWSWSESFDYISPNAITGPRFVIALQEDMSQIMVTRPFTEWPAQFDP